MSARPIHPIETSVELFAAAAFGGAVAYAATAWLASPYFAAAGIPAFLICLRVMKIATRREYRMPVAIFDVRDIEPEFDELLLTDDDRLDGKELVLTDADRADREELVLTDADRVQPSAAEPLVLDDILAEIGPDARVVRLFDRKAMPTPAQLKARIDDHLGQGTPPAPLSDASQALSEALAQLRRSLR